MNRQELIKQTGAAASKLLREKGSISVVEVLMEMGKLSRVDHENWRFQQVPYLEKVITVNLSKINLILKTIQKNARNSNLKASHTVYTSWGKGPRQVLRFSKSGAPHLEQAYSTHFIKRTKDRERGKTSSAIVRITRIVVDEAVSMAQFARFETFAGEKGIDTSDCIFIKDAHPGMPDSQIVQHYLDETTILLTTDRPFHNTVLAKGLRSYYIDQNKITKKPLPGIRPKPDVTPTKSDLILKESYRQPSVEIRPLLLPASPRQLKKLQVKRRRIRNHFGGQDHLDQVAVTVSWRTLGDQTLLGIRVRISSNVGLKALDASESYLVEKIDPDRRGLVAVCHALVLLIQLMLHPVKTLVYYDAHNIDNPLAQASPEVGDRYQAFFNTLFDCFEDVEFVPAPKGKYVEKLRRKLDQLARDDRTNEIVPRNILEMIDIV